MFESVSNILGETFPGIEQKFIRYAYPVAPEPVVLLEKTDKCKFCVLPNLLNLLNAAAVHKALMLRTVVAYLPNLLNLLNAAAIH